MLQVSRVVQQRADIPPTSEPELRNDERPIQEAVERIVHGLVVNEYMDWPICFDSGVQHKSQRLGSDTSLEGVPERSPLPRRKPRGEPYSTSPGDGRRPASGGLAR